MAGLGIYRHIEYQGCGIKEAATYISEKGLWVQVVCPWEGSARSHESETKCGEFRKLKIPGTWIGSWGKLQTMSKAIPRERQWGLQGPSLCTFYYTRTCCVITQVRSHWAHVAVLFMELQGLVFALLDCFLSSFTLLPILEWECLLCVIICCQCLILFFIFTGAPC